MGCDCAGSEHKKIALADTKYARAWLVKPSLYINQPHEERRKMSNHYSDLRMCRDMNDLCRHILPSELGRILIADRNGLLADEYLAILHDFFITQGFLWVWLANNLAQFACLGVVFVLFVAIAASGTFPLAVGLLVPGG